MVDRLQIRAGNRNLMDVGSLVKSLVTRSVQLPLGTRFHGKKLCTSGTSKLDTRTINLVFLNHPARDLQDNKQVVTTITQGLIEQGSPGDLRRRQFLVPNHELSSLQNTRETR